MKTMKTKNYTPESRKRYYNLDAKIEAAFIITGMIIFIVGMACLFLHANGYLVAG